MRPDTKGKNAMQKAGAAASDGGPEITVLSIHNPNDYCAATCWVVFDVQVDDIVVRGVQLHWQGRTNWRTGPPGVEFYWHWATAIVAAVLRVLGETIEVRAHQAEARNWQTEILQ